MEKRAVSIRGLEKAAVLAALYNRAAPRGMGFKKYDPKPMTVEEARVLLAHFERVTKKRLWWEIEVRPALRPIQFDYLSGRAMKVDLSSDNELDAGAYDHAVYNGADAAEEAIQALRMTGDVNPPSSQIAHSIRVFEAAKAIRGGESGE